MSKRRITIRVRDLVTPLGPDEVEQFEGTKRWHVRYPEGIRDDYGCEWGCYTRTKRGALTVAADALRCLNKGGGQFMRLPME